jgi:N-acetylmuramoyl-L-alanine amidase
MVKICIDPGHGGVDPGAIGPTGLKEKDVNLAVGLKLAELLKPIAEVKLTRTRDVAVSLKDRAAIANSFGCDYFISVHANSFKDRKVGGVETWAYAKGGQGEKLAKAVQAELVKVTGFANRGVKFNSGFAVLRDTRAPAILTESGFISNPAEEKLLKTGAFRDKIAMAIAQGVANRIGKKLPEPKPAQAPAQPATLPKIAKQIAVRVDGKPVSAVGYLINNTTYLQGLFVAGLFGGSATGHGDYIDIKTKKG